MCSSVICVINRVLLTRATMEVASICVINRVLLTGATIEVASSSFRLMKWFLNDGAHSPKIGKNRNKIMGHFFWCVILVVYLDHMGFVDPVVSCEKSSFIFLHKSVFGRALLTPFEPPNPSLY